MSDISGVELKNVRKVYPNGYVAVKDVSLSIDNGEFVTLVGPSGCGKSTLLRLIAGLEDVTSGEILMDGRVVNELAPKDRNIAMVFQYYALYPHMTVRQNMAFALRQTRMPKAEIAERVAYAAAILELCNLLDRKPKELSGGQRQRVAVGRAIVRDADIFLFDEPLSNLDASLRTQMRTEIVRLHQRLGKTMIYVTHDQVEAMTMAERIAVVNGGNVLQFDSPLTIYGNPANEFVARFIGSPAMNLIEGRISWANGAGKTACFTDTTSNLRIDLPKAIVDRFKLPEDGNVKFGIRPEDIVLDQGQGERANQAFLTLRIDILEPIGNEVIVHCGLSKGGESTIVSRGRLNELPSIGSLETFRVDLDKAIFFDAKSNLSLFSN